MRLVLLLVVVAGVANAYIDRHDYTQCFKRNLRVGDVITVRGKILNGATRWTCNIAMSELNNLIIHADHRIRPTSVEGAYGTHVTARIGTTKWLNDNFKAAIPFTSGPFELVFSIVSEGIVEIVYKNAVFNGTSFDRGTNIPLSVVRQIDCSGDLIDITFHGDMMRDKVLPVANRDCLMFPPEPAPQRRPPVKRPIFDRHLRRDHDRDNKWGDSDSKERGFNGFNIETSDERWDY
ncbi:unnamed protein product, partial [Mesorhabditis spiculigera]